MIVLDKRLMLILWITVCLTIALFSFEPIKQDTHSHAFADHRTFILIPNFFNVISNIPLLIIGYLGTRLMWPLRQNMTDLDLDNAYWLFFMGVFLSGIGSILYDLHPTNANLLWDRLPLALAFMAFFTVIIGECIAKKLAIQLFVPLLMLGAGATLYWYISELRGHSDLRAYLLVQILPLILIPIILRLYNGEQKNCHHVWLVFTAYCLAKIVESFDDVIYQNLHFISGHALKHVLIAAGVYVVYLMEATNRSLIKE